MTKKQISPLEQYANQGKFVKIKEVGDSVELIVKGDPHKLVPRPGNFKDQATGLPKLVIDYTFTDPETNEEKIFTNGSQTVAGQMCKMKDGDRIKIIKIERNGKAAYTVKRIGEKPADLEGEEEVSEPKNEEGLDKLPF